MKCYLETKCTYLAVHRLLWALSLANAFTAYYCLDGGNAWDFTSGNGELYMLNPGCSPANSAAPGFCTAPATLVGRYYQQALPILLVAVLGLGHTV